MQLDDLKSVWAAHGAALERSLAINEALLREVMLRKVRSTLVPYVLWLGVEVAFGILCSFLVGAVLFAHLDEPRYLLWGGGLWVYALAVTALSLHLRVRVAQIDYGGPVTAMQREVERVKRLAYRAFKWVLLGGIAFWLPALLVPFEALTGVPALGAVDGLWLAGNVVVGLLLLALGQWLARKHVERAPPGSRGGRIVDALSGRRLEAATRFLAELSSFEREP